jgi:hypothetical protein
MLEIRYPYDLSIGAVVAEQQKHATQGGGAPCIQTCKAESRYSNQGQEHWSHIRDLLLRVEPTLLKARTTNP